jgi:hypothetical protein
MISRQPGKWRDNETQCAAYSLHLYRKHAHEYRHRLTLSRPFIDQRAL